jgi:hypothetical protein
VFATDPQETNSTGGVEFAYNQGPRHIKKSINVRLAGNFLSC